MDVPMYQCDGCGWTTTGFRLDAVHDHAGDCPSCMGTIRLVFHVGVDQPERDPSRSAMKLVPDAAAAAPAPAPGHERTRIAPGRP